MKSKTLNEFLAILKAKEIIQQLGIEEPEHIDLEAIAFMRKAIVKEDALEKADGRLSTLSSPALITVRKDIPEAGRKRFVIAHELGHHELHRKKENNISCAEEAFDNWNIDKSIEAEANYFAAELLMPEQIFKEITDSMEPSLDSLKELCNLFHTTFTSTAIRFATLHPEYALVCSNGEGIKWFIANHDFFTGYINIYGRVHQDSIAYDIFHGGEAPSKFFPVDSSAWLERPAYGQLKELAIPLSSYGQVLSFLYIDE